MKAAPCRQGVVCYGMSFQTHEHGNWKDACCSVWAGTMGLEDAESMDIAFGIVQELMNGRDSVGNLYMGAAGLKSQLGSEPQPHRSP